MTIDYCVRINNLQQMVDSQKVLFAMGYRWASSSSKELVPNILDIVTKYKVTYPIYLICYPDRSGLVKPMFYATNDSMYAHHEPMVELTIPVVDEILTAAALGFNPFDNVLPIETDKK